MTAFFFPHEAGLSSRSKRFQAILLSRSFLTSSSDSLERRATSSTGYFPSFSIREAVSFMPSFLTSSIILHIFILSRSFAYLRSICSAISKAVTAFTLCVHNHSIIILPHLQSAGKYRLLSPSLRFLPGWRGDSPVKKSEYPHKALRSGDTPVILSSDSALLLNIFSTFETTFSNPPD